MALVTVDLADLKVSDDPEAVLVTYALGSCIALVAWDPLRRVGGMLHYMLPSSSVAPHKVKSQPGMFADTGIPLLLAAMEARGARAARLALRAAGGARRWDDGGTFDIGRRNHVALRKLLWQRRLLLAAEDVGGTRSRTVRLAVASGLVTVHSEGEQWPL